MKDLDVAPDGKWARRARRARLPRRREEAAGRRLLPREHRHRRADAHRQGPADRPPRASASRRTARTSSTGRTASSRPTTSTRTRRATLGGTAAPSFVDMEDDHPGTKPSYGIAGYASDGKAVIVNHRYDLWLLPLDGSAPDESDRRPRHARTRYVSASSGPSRWTRRVPRAVGPRGTFDLDQARSPCRPTASGRRRPASTNWPAGR